MTPEERRDMVRDAIERSGLPKTLIARDAGLSRDALYAWITRDLPPSPESVRQLAAGFEARGRLLLEIAEELRIPISPPSGGEADRSLTYTHLPGGGG